MAPVHTNAEFFVGRADPAAFTLAPDFWERPDVCAALRARNVGTLFGLVRKYAGASQTGIGMRIGAAQPEVNVIMAGARQVTALATFERIADGLAMSPSARALLGLAAARESARPDGGSSPPGSGDGIDAVLELWSADAGGGVAPSDFAAGLFATEAFGWTTRPPLRSGAGGAEGRVGTSDVAAIRSLTRSLRDFDNRFGGGGARSIAVHCLNDQVAPLLRGRSHDHAARSALFAATAELTRLAAWMAYDVEMHGVAQRYLVHALRLAAESGDGALGGEVLADMSHQSIYLGRPAEAVDLACAAQRSAAAAAVPTLLAEACVLEAHGHALQGDRAACDQALRSADQAFDMSDRRNEPEWIGYLDEAYLAARFARCLLDLGRLEDAERYAVRSLDMDRRFVRGEMFNTALLATIHVERGEIDGACEVGLRAIDMTRGLRSARATRCVRELDRRLAAFGQVQAVRVFHEAAVDLLHPAA